MCCLFVHSLAKQKTKSLERSSSSQRTPLQEYNGTEEKNPVDISYSDFTVRPAF
jgi:hypothetical protein